MLKKIFLLFIFTLFSVIFPTKVAAQERRSVKVTTVPADQVITQDFLIKGGEVVEISGTVNGDVIVAGGDVLVEGEVNGDLIAAGGKVKLTGVVTQDLRVAGGEIKINGKVGRNVSLAGGDVEISSSSLGGGVIILGGDVKISSPIKGDLLVYAGSLVLEDNVEGNVEATVGTFRIASGSEISGNVTYTSDTEATIDKGASISGRVVRIPTKESAIGSRLSEVENFSKKVSDMQVETKLISFFAALIIGLLIIKFFPNFTKDTGSIISERTRKALGVGFLVVFFTPFAILLIMLTIVGIPFAILSLFAYITCLYISKIFISYEIGQRVFGDKMKESRYLPFFLGLIVYYLITFIPKLGPIVAFILTILGVGAVILGTREYYREAVLKKIV